VSAATQETARLRAFREATERFAEAFNAGDFKRASAALSDDFEQHFHPSFPERSVRGREAWIAFFEEYSRDIEGWHMAPHEFVEVGPTTFVLGIDYMGTGRSSGARSEIAVWNLVELDPADGRIRRIGDFLSRDAALAAARGEERAG